MKINHEETKTPKKARKAFVFFVSTWLIFWGGSKRISYLPTSGQGPEWSGQSSGALAKLSGVFFVDCDRGWVVGSNGTLLATEDGGAKWRRQTLPERQNGEALNDVWFFNPDRGLLLGEYGLFNRKGDIDRSERGFLIMSKDRGANWEAGALRRPPDSTLLRMAFANDRLGWARRGSGVW